MDYKKKRATVTSAPSQIPTKTGSPTPKKHFANREKSDILIREDQASMPLERSNFKIMIIAAIMIIAGFLLMLGGSSTETEFNPDIFSTRRIVIGPTIAFLGFLVMGYGIIYLPGRRRKSSDSEAAKQSTETETEKA